MDPLSNIDKMAVPEAQRLMVGSIKSEDSCQREADSITSFQTLQPAKVKTEGLGHQDSGSVLTMGNTSADSQVQSNDETKYRDTGSSAATGAIGVGFRAADDVYNNEEDEDSDSSTFSGRTVSSLEGNISEELDENETGKNHKDLPQSDRESSVEAEASGVVSLQENKDKTQDVGNNKNMPLVLKGPFVGLDAFRMCRICGENFKNPRLLKCLHTYCIECIQSLIQVKQEKNYFFCPQCKLEVSAEDLSNLPVHHVSKRLSEGRSLINNSQKCSICALHEELLPAVKICFECKDFLCEGCADKHKFSRFTIDHKITELDENSLLKSLEKVHVDMFCKEHEKEEVRFFCDDCLCLVCRDCVILNHSDHKVIPVNKAVTARRKELEFRMNILKEQQKEAENELKLNEEVMKNLQKLQDNEIAKIKSEVEQMKQRLAQEEEEAISGITKKVSNALKPGKKRKTNTQKLLDHIEEVNAHCLKFLNESTDEEFLANENIFMGAITTTLNASITPDPLSWSKSPYIQSTKILKLAKIEPLFVVKDRKRVYDPVEDMPTQFTYAEMLSKKLKVEHGMDYSLRVQNKVKARQKAETKQVKNAEKREMKEALNKLKAPATTPKVQGNKAVETKPGGNKPKSGEDNSQEGQITKKKRNRRSRKNKSKDTNSENQDENTIDPEVKLKGKVDAAGKWRQQVLTGVNGNNTLSMAHPGQLNIYGFDPQMAMVDGAIGGIQRNIVPTLTPQWRIDVWLRTDQFQPNITATLCIGKDKIAVADSINNKVKVFATSGEFLESHDAFQPVSLAYCAGKLIWCSENTLGFIDFANKEREELTFDLDVVPHPLSTGSMTQLFVGNGQNVCEYSWTKKEKYWAQNNKIVPRKSKKKPLKGNIMSLTNSTGGQVIVFSDWKDGSVVFMDKDGLVFSVYKEIENQNGFLPTGLFYDRSANTVFVLDHQGNRLLLLSGDGKLIQEWSTLPAIQKPLSVAGNKSQLLFLTGNDQFLHVYQFSY